MQRCVALDLLEGGDVDGKANTHEEPGECLGEMLSVGRQHALRDGHITLVAEIVEELWLSTSALSEPYPDFPPASYWRIQDL